MDIKDKWIYFAGPLFTAAERQFNELLSQYIEQAGYAVYLPQKECQGISSANDIFRHCIKGLDNAWCVVALVDGADTDSGTCFEMGYAYAKGIPIIGLRTDFRKSADDGHVNLMLSQSVATLCFVNSLETISIEEIGYKLKDEISRMLVKVIKS
ncbi:MAG TPA: nucleoside 2-deoxyribosyltransferase [Spirochaetota bacterium]|nr:nucleoside 2-deoxyribosyltransferase [Spirochaetota bacterium]HOM10864.1 nucleoside 2-deoxyribosyltransferase [Spirochaetota bacterium]HPP50279.1 nucleoside 2-deoxyribosyltransferase [Spirochaetota bacterium]HXK65992.1 nucleoside 2-deoxyribosyltransferase [Spirochaetota bacterium]